MKYFIITVLLIIPTLGCASDSIVKVDENTVRVTKTTTDDVKIDELLRDRERSLGKISLYQGRISSNQNLLMDEQDKLNALDKQLSEYKKVGVEGIN